MRLEKLLYFLLIAVSNHDGLSFYSDERLRELLEIRHPHKLTGARNELIDRGLLAYAHPLYQVLELPARSALPSIERAANDKNDYVQRAAKYAAACLLEKC